MELFAKTVNGFKLLTISAKKLHLKLNLRIQTDRKIRIRKNFELGHFSCRYQFRPISTLLEKVIFFSWFFIKRPVSTNYNNEHVKIIYIHIILIYNYIIYLSVSIKKIHCDFSVLSAVTLQQGSQVR